MGSPPKPRSPAPCSPSPYSRNPCPRPRGVQVPLPVAGQQGAVRSGVFSALRRKGFTAAADAYEATGALDSIRFKASILAPTNEAFENLPEELKMALADEEMGLPLLKKIMLNHLLKKSRTSAQFLERWADYDTLAKTVVRGGPVELDQTVHAQWGSGTLQGTTTSAPMSPPPSFLSTATATSRGSTLSSFLQSSSPRSPRRAPCRSTPTTTRTLPTDPYAPPRRGTRVLPRVPPGRGPCVLPLRPPYRGACVLPVRPPHRGACTCPLRPPHRGPCVCPLRSCGGPRVPPLLHAFSSKGVHP